MRLVRVVVAILVVLGAGGAQAAGALWHRSATLDYRVNPDGTSTATEIWEVRADSASVAHTIAQQSFSYIADLDQVELVAAYTSKADGRTILVPPDSVLAQAVTTTATSPQFSALTSRTIVFPQVAAGDTVHYELRRTTKETLFPGEFTLTLEAGGPATTERADISIALPPGRTLRVAASGLEEAAPEPGEAGGTVRRWRLAPRATGPIAIDASTFTDYAALGRAYAARAWPRSQPGPSVQALADRLTAGVADQRETALRLYGYVSNEIRYVATFLGNGRVVPRSAETVLAEGWGDCKDHAALLQALLVAKGIEAQPALISLHNLYTLPEAPGLGALDHVITYVPSLDLYLDSTAPYAPFGLLPAAEYDKPVVIAHPTAARLARTPAMPQGAMVLTTRTTARIGEDGTITGRTTTAASGPQGIALRSMAAWFEGRGAAYSANNQLQLLGTPGVGRFSFEPPEAASGEYRIEGRFTLDDPVQDGGAAPFPVPSGLGVFGRPGKLLLNTANTDDGGHACYPGREVEEIVLELPPGASLAKRPEDVTLQDGGARYAARYTNDETHLRVRREFSVETEGQFCREAEFAPMRRVLSAARRDQQAHIALVRPTQQRIANVPQ
ncbi:MAG TPA: DUF3857 and transglutaminase domain-containing protein [Acetobacteraceae bacterium]|nr:DUF3857 and transglutaminase domain-containing protein [Acetobacteraceae bacterium]